MDSRLILILALYGISFIISSTQGQLDLQSPIVNGFPFNSLKTRKNDSNIPQAAPSNDVANDLTQPWRLSRDIIPHLYKLNIIPILDAGQPVGDQWTVPGSVGIEVTANATTRNVTIHKSEDMIVKSITVKLKPPYIQKKHLIGYLINSHIS